MNNELSIVALAFGCLAVLLFVVGEVVSWYMIWDYIKAKDLSKLLNKELQAWSILGDILIITAAGTFFAFYRGCHSCQKPDALFLVGEVCLCFGIVVYAKTFEVLHKTLQTVQPPGVANEKKNTGKDQVECETICSDEDESIASAMERGEAGMKA